MASSGCLGSADAMVFAGPGELALDLIEQKLGRHFQGLGAAAAALAKTHGACKLVNKTTRMARDLHVASCLERHFTSIGTQQWLETFSRSLALIGEEVPEVTCSGSDDDISEGSSAAPVPCNKVGKGSDDLTESVRKLQCVVTELEQRVRALEVPS